MFKIGNMLQIIERNKILCYTIYCDKSLYSDEELKCQTVLQDG